MNGLDELKMVLRAMLIASPKGLNRNEIYRSYKQMEGRPLPIRDLGFSSPEDLFSSLRDVMQVCYVNGEAVYVAVDVPETQHLTKMIQKQKPNRKSRRPNLRPVQAPQWSRSTFLRHSGPPKQAPRPLASLRLSPRPMPVSDLVTFLQPNQQMSGEEFTYFVTTTTPSSSQQQQQQQQQLVTTTTAKQQTTTTTTTTTPTRPQSNNYSPTTGSNRASSSSNQQNGPRIRSVPASIQNNVRLLLDGVKDGIMGSVLATYYHKRFGTPLEYQRYNFPTLLDMLSAMTDVAHIERKSGGIYRAFGIECAKALIQAQQASKPRLARAPSSEGAAEEEPGGGARRRHKSRRSVESDLTVPQEVKDNIRKLFVGNLADDGIGACHVLREYKLANNTELNLPKLGYSSVVELMAAIPSVVTIERPERSGDWILYDAQTHPPTATSNPTIPQVRNNWRQELKSLLESYPQGLYLQELPEIYKTLYQEELDPPLLGYSNLYDMMLELKGDLIDRVQHVHSNKVMIYPLIWKPEPKVVRPALSLRGPAMARPDDRVLPGTRYKPRPIPDGIRSAGWFACTVSHVVNAGQFCVQLVLEEDGGIQPLEELMDKLEDVYASDDGDQYVILDDELKLNMACTAIFPETMDWHRCVLTKILENCAKLEVYYVDYGGVSIVDRKYIRYLRNEHMNLPAQAIDATLHGIKKVNGKYWTLDCKRELLNMTSDRPLLASLRSLSECRKMHLCLCDTNGAEDVHINDRLVELGLALYDGGEEDLGNNDEVGVVSDTGSSHDGERCRRYVRPVSLTSLHKTHIINLEGRAYIASPEIAYLLWDTDQLRSMLRQRKLKIDDKMVVSREDQEDLFNEFDQMNIADLKDKEYTTLYALSTVPTILEGFRHPDKELINKLKELDATFDAQDSYWRRSYEDDEESMEETIERIGLPELQMMLKALQFRRQDFLHRLTKSGEPLVDELKEVEIQINSVSKKIKSLEEKGHTSELSLTENEKYTVDCVRVQYASPGKHDTQMTSQCADVVSDVTTSVAELKLSGATYSTGEKLSPNVNRVYPMRKHDVTSGVPDPVVTSNLSVTAASFVASSSAMTSAGLPDEAMIRQACDLAYQTTMENLYVTPQVLLAQRPLSRAVPQYTCPPPTLNWMPNVPYVPSHVPSHVPPQTNQFAAYPPQYPAAAAAQYGQVPWMNHHVYDPQRMSPQQTFYSPYGNPGMSINNWPPKPK